MLTRDELIDRVCETDRARNTPLRFIRTGWDQPFRYVLQPAPLPEFCATSVLSAPERWDITLSDLIWHVIICGEMTRTRHDGDVVPSDYCAMLTAVLDCDLWIDSDLDM